VIESIDIDTATALVYMQSPDAHEKFLEITTAYDVLKDEEERANYDYMLDNPDEVYSHYYHYYRRRVAPKVDVRIVIAVTITVISVVQYIGWSHSYNAALSAALRMPHYRTRAKGIARERGLLDRKKKGVLKVRDKETCGTMCLLMNQVEFVNESGRVC
jgi:DnaJ family protein C protein 25